MNPVQKDRDLPAKTLESHTEKLRSSSKNDHDLIMALEPPTIVRAPTNVLRRNTAGKEEPSKVQEQSLSSMQATSNDKPEMSSSNGLKRKRGDPSATAEAGQKVRQRLNAAEASSSQSSPSSSRTNSNNPPPTNASQNVYGPLHLVDPSHGMAYVPPKVANLNNLASPYAKPLITRPCSHGLPNFNPVNQPPANQVSPYASSMISNQISGSGLVGSDHNQANKHNGHGTHDSDKEAHTPHQNFISPDSRQQAYSVHDDSLPSAPRISIDPNKLDGTTLWISLASSSDATPITLRSCMTMSSLFDTVFQLCDLDEQQEKVLGLRTSLDWQQNADMKKSLVLKRRFEDSFEVFLKMINASPSWESDRCCSVTIEVVMAPGQT